MSARKIIIRVLLPFIIIGLIGYSMFFAAKPQEFTLTIQNSQFSPAELVIPANKQVKVTIINNDPTAEEFESHELNREILVKGNSSASMMLGPLKAGTYSYVGEFNEKVANGKITAK